MKSMALTMTTNMMAVVRELMHVPPVFNSTLQPSWKPASAAPAFPLSAQPAAAAGSKRPAEANGDADSAGAAKKPAASISLYQPPGGKFSGRAGPAPGAAAAAAGGGGRGFARGGGRGGFRGYRGYRGGGGGWRRGRW